MDSIFYVIVGILFILAISDLVVGVSNDAVNFLNSAIGSNAASRKVIYAVAAAGILVGSSFSNGMMEIARSGIIHPELFLFTDVMMIYLAVMLADVILLDLFNTFGLPTSTTVSIIFELLGAGVVMAVFKTTGAGMPLDAIAPYINTEKATTIVSSILLSVALAFCLGALIQYFTRLLFSFNYHKRLPYFGAAWAGLAMTSLTYFLVLKGLKGTSFATPEMLQFMSDHQAGILIGSFVFWGVVFQISISVLKKNIFRFVVLSGTFALAFAFAGNDLVNFIGVPLAGFHAFTMWSQSGLEPGSMTMESLNYPQRADIIFLVVAGLIMVLTLYFSKKAKTVTETQVGLSRQEEGEERFKPHRLSRYVVKGAMYSGRVFRMFLPRAFWRTQAKNFSPPKVSDDNTAFDLVRAAVNLTVGSALIALGTSFKLPLSTTYVTFMVAMGTSLSDKAWGRDSAVYRVSGVLNVIGGWFFTGLAAFALSGLFVAILAWMGFNATFLLLGIVILAVGRSILAHRSSEKKKEKKRKGTLFQLSKRKDFERLKVHVSRTLQQAAKSSSSAILGLVAENRQSLVKSAKELEDLRMEYSQVEVDLYRSVKSASKDELERFHSYFNLFGNIQDLFQSAQFLVNLCQEHVRNHHNPPTGKQKELLLEVSNRNSQLLEKAAKFEGVKDEQKALDDAIRALLNYQFSGVQEGKLGAKNSLLHFRIASEIGDLTEVAEAISENIREIIQSKSPS
jgi:phosphate/sulfate permease